MGKKRKKKGLQRWGYHRPPMPPTVHPWGMTVEEFEDWVTPLRRPEHRKIVRQWFDWIGWPEGFRYCSLAGPAGTRSYHRSLKVGAVRILGARFIFAREDGDIEGAKDLQARMEQIMPREWKKELLDHFGDPDDPEEHEEALLKAEVRIEQTPVDVLDALFFD